MSIAELTDKALALPPEEKAELNDALVNSMPPPLSMSDEDAIALALERDREMDENPDAAISHEEFLKHFPDRNGIQP